MSAVRLLGIVLFQQKLIFLRNASAVAAGQGLARIGEAEPFYVL